jgi:hypothetical protein
MVLADASKFRETVVVIAEAFILLKGLLLLLLDVFILSVVVISRRLVLSTVRSVGGNSALKTNIKNILLALERTFSKAQLYCSLK